MANTENTKPVRVAALYRFARLDACRALQAPLKALCEENGIKGTLLLAREGINGTVAGSGAAIEVLLGWLRAIPALDGLDVKFSTAETMPFHRMKVRLKREIVTMGVVDLDPSSEAGTHVEPMAWNALISDPETVIIDTRNDYETALGTFAGAIDPQTASFTAFPSWADGQAERLHGRKVAMFCTGGIRCEKATAYMRRIGVEEVYHLKGGILRYLEEVPAQDSLWQGECFVFDERVSLRHGLETGEAELCRACRHPLTRDDRMSPLFVEGVSCHRCHDTRTDEDRARYAERHRQVALASRRGGESHIGRRDGGSRTD